MALLPDAWVEEAWKRSFHLPSSRWINDADAEMNEGDADYDDIDDHGGRTLDPSPIRPRNRVARRTYRPIS